MQPINDDEKPLKSMTQLTDESCYFKWSYDIKQILEQKALWRVVQYANIEMFELFRANRQGDLRIDATAERAIEVHQGVAQQVQISVAQRETWTQMDEKAKGYIGKSVGELFYQIVSDQPPNATARDLWNQIENRCRTVNHSLRINLESEYNLARMKDKEEPRQYLDRITTMTNRLATMQVQIPQPRIVAKVMSTMTDQFLPLRQTVETLLRSMPEAQHTTAFLLQQFTGHHNLNQQNKSRAYGALNTEYNRRRTQSNFKAGIVCYYCNKEGHYERDCRQKKKENFRKDPKRSQYNNRNFQGNRNNHNGGYQNQNANQNQVQNANNAVPNRNVNANQNQRRPQLRRPTNSNNAEEQNPNAMIVEEVLSVGADLKSNGAWILDSGCTKHMTPNAKLLHNIRPLDQPTHVRGAMKKELQEVRYEGEAYLDTTSNFKLLNVLLVPGMRRNLIAQRKLTKAGAKVVADDEEAIVYVHGQPTLEFKLNEEMLYELVTNNKPQECHSVEFASKDDEALYWHEALGHLSISGLKKLQDQGAINTALKGNEQIECIACEKGKATRKPFQNVQKEIQTTKIGELIHSDLCGPITPESLTGKRYFVTYTDDFTRYTTTYFLEKKSEQIDRFREYKAMMKIQHGADIVKFRTDAGGEYTSNEFEEMLAQEGAEHQSRPPRTSEWRGVAERLNRTLMDKARAMLKAKELPNELWAAAVNYATLLKNCSETSIMPKTTPYEKLYGEKPPYKRLGIFGSTVEYKDNQPKKKLEDRTTTGIYLGYDRAQHCARILNVHTSNVTFARSSEIFFHDYNYFQDNAQDLIQIQDQTSSQEKEVIVIDDSEEDSSTQLEEEGLPRVELPIAEAEPGDNGAQPPWQPQDQDEEPIGAQPHADPDRNEEPIAIEDEIEKEKQPIIYISDEEEEPGSEYEPEDEQEAEPQPGDQQRVRSSARVRINKILKQQKSLQRKEETELTDNKKQEEKAEPIPTKKTHFKSKRSRKSYQTRIHSRTNQSVTRKSQKEKIKKSGWQP
jgi:transposase InsO family protein